jgi:hypothetical protein
MAGAGMSAITHTQPTLRRPGEGSGAAAADTDDVFLDLHSVACICGSPHIADFLVSRHSPGWVLHYTASP